MMASEIDKPPSCDTNTSNEGIPSYQLPSGPYGPYTQVPPPPGYYPSVHPPNSHNFVPSYGSTQSTIITIPDIVVVGGCPACRVGVMEDDYSCLGVMCAILLFPIGILCCLMLKTRRCSNCGAYFD